MIKQISVQAIKLILLLWVFQLPAAILAQNTMGKVLSVEDMHADFDTLHSVLRQSHPNLYRSASEEATEKRWQKTREKINKPLSTNEFLNLIVPLVNQYNDGHTFMDMPWETEYFDEYMKKGGRFFPFKIWVNGDKLLVTESWGTTKFPAGTEIGSINGKNAKELLKELEPLAGGDSEEGKKEVLSRLFNLELWQKYGWGNQFELEARKPGTKKSVKITAAGITFEELSKIMFGEKAVYAYELTPEIIVLEVNKMQSKDEVKKYIDETFTKIKEKNYPFLVIDLRKNSGGDSTVGNWVLEYLTQKSFNQGGTKEVKISPFLLENNKFYKNWIPKLKENYPVIGDKIVMKFAGEEETVKKEKWIYEGKVFMLTSARTYSSGFMMAEAFKCYNFGKMIGSAPGSYRNLTGELMQFKLPKSKLIGYVSTAHYYPPCYQKAKTDFLQPDVLMEQSIGDTNAGKDTVLEYIKSLSTKN